MGLWRCCELGVPMFLVTSRVKTLIIFGSFLFFFSSFPLVCLLLLQFFLCFLLALTFWLVSSYSNVFSGLGSSLK